MELEECADDALLKSGPVSPKSCREPRWPGIRKHPRKTPRTIVRSPGRCRMDPFVDCRAVVFIGGNHLLRRFAYAHLLDGHQPDIFQRPMIE